MPTEPIEPRARPLVRGAAAAAKPRRILRRVVVALFVLVGVPVLLFVVNGTLLYHGETPVAGTVSKPPRDSLDDRHPLTVKVLSFNIAKCFAFREGSGFDSVAAVQGRIDRIAKVIRDEQPDFVFLSEVLAECGPCPVDQVTAIASASRMHAWVFGEDFNIGVPGYRMVCDNAVLSPWPMESVTNISLVGRKPFYVTKNNRRALWCAAQIGGRRVLLASLHNDTFDRANNLRQMQQILDFAGEREAILAGDFNAFPNWPAIQVVRESGRFVGEFDGPKTFPSEKPERTIDFIFAPSAWELLEHRVIDNDVSDHRPIVSVFRVKTVAGRSSTEALQSDRRATAEKTPDFAAMIDALASKNVAPELIDRVSGRDPLFPANFDWQEQTRARRAFADLGNTDVDELWDELRKHRSDDRYSFTAGDDAAYDGWYATNYSVGNLCGMIAAYWLTLPYQTHLVTVDDRKLRIDFNLNVDALRQARPEIKLYELQIKACEMALAQIPTVPGASEEQKDRMIREIEAEVAALRASKKAKFSKYRIDRYNFYDADRARKIRDSQKVK